MASRRQIPPPNAVRLREVPPPRTTTSIGDSRLLHRGAQPSAYALTESSHRSTALEDRIAIQHREIQSLLQDNQLLAATHVALKQELAASQHELRALAAFVAEVKAERNAQVREVYERSLKMDAEARGVDAMSVELAQVREDVKKLGASQKELGLELQKVEGELERARREAKEVPAIKAEIESLEREIHRGRASIEQEKKTRAINLHYHQEMEKKIVSMIHEIEKLRDELANAEKRARAAAAAANPNPGYAGIPGNPDMGYAGQPYHDPYSMHMVQNVPDANAQYGAGHMPHGYDMQQTNMYR
ncbi:hypothetical protein UlMin_013096 [Ulmus minor]